MIEKLIQFKNNEDLKYTYVIEVIIGNEILEKKSDKDHRMSYHLLITK